MTAKQHVVQLTPDQRTSLTQLLTRTGASAHEHRRARILLQTDCAGGRSQTDEAVATAVLVSPRTVARTRSAFATQGLDAALARKPRTDTPPRKLAGAVETALVDLACSAPPAGYARWTLRLLANELVLLDLVDGISPETIRLALKKTS